MTEPKEIVPGRFAVMAQPDLSDLSALADQGYRTLIGNRPDKEAAGQPSAADVRHEAERQGMRYVHLPVTEPGITREDVERFRAALQDAPAPVVAHCGGGKRAFLLWAAGELLYGGRQREELQEQARSAGFDPAALDKLMARIG